MDAASNALKSGDVSTIESQTCMYIQNETAYASYEEERLFKIWARDNHDARMQGQRMAHISSSFRMIYATYASRCCEVGRNLLVVNRIFRHDVHARLIERKTTGYGCSAQVWI